MKIKKGDKVIVRTGKDKGKTGTVLTVFPLENKVLVDAINLKKNFVKATGSVKPEIVERPAPMHIAKVMLIDPATKKPTRVGYTYGTDGKKVRVAKKTGKAITTSA